MCKCDMHFFIKNGYIRQVVSCCYNTLPYLYNILKILKIYNNKFVYDIKSQILIWFVKQ